MTISLRKILSDYKVDLIFAFKLRFRRIPFPKSPMIELELQELFLKLGSTNQSILEFGSGASTIFLAKIFDHVHSVESSRSWSRMVEAEIEFQNVKNVTLDVISVGLTGQGGIPIFKLLSRLTWRNNRRYSIEPFNHNAYDVVFIDGRFRLACFANALIRNKKENFVIVLDDYFESGGYFPEFLEPKSFSYERCGRALVLRICPQTDRELFSTLELVDMYKDFN